MFKVGDTAPDFSSVNQNDKTVSLKGLKGKTVVLYFYPKDDTPGCTKEACGFRDNTAALKKKGVVVLGVSKDGVASHKKFTTKYKLPFDLLADEKLEIIKSYGAWGEKSLYGKKYMGVFRITYVIDPKGKVAAVFPKVSPAEHAEEILATV